MKAEEFWDIYINSTENTLDIYDEVIAFFSEDLPEGMEEEYDVEEIVHEVQGHHKTAKEFEKVIAFAKLLKSKHPKIYSEVETYSNDFLINYFAYQNNVEEIKSNFEYIAQNAEDYYEDFLSIFKTILFYQHIDILDSEVDQIIEMIRNSDLIDVKNEYDLASFKFFNTLEKQYLESQKRGVFDQEIMIEELNQYSFDIEKLKKSISLFENNFSENLDTVSILKRVAINKTEGLQIIQAQFIKSMLQKKIHFVTSARIWGLMMRYWISNNGESQDYFAIDTQELYNFLQELSGDFFSNDKAEKYAMLWGSVYVYDFLSEKKLIDATTYKNFRATSQELKGLFIVKNPTSLWKCNFVHQWKKPDSILENEFEAEAKIFEKSMPFNKRIFLYFKPMIATELETIGELLESILKAEEKMAEEKIKSDQRLKHFFGDSVPPINLKPITKTIQEKIGRNDPCHCGSGKKFKKCCLN